MSGSMIIAAPDRSADVGAFCFAVARNLVHDHLRRRRAAGPHAELSDEIACPAPRADEILAYRERVEVLIRALKAMPPLRREVFTAPQARRPGDGGDRRRPGAERRRGRETLRPRGRGSPLRARSARARTGAGRMTDRRALEQAARWALRDGGDTPPPLADKVQRDARRSRARRGAGGMRLDRPAFRRAMCTRMRAGRRRALASPARRPCWWWSASGPGRAGCSRRRRLRSRISKRGAGSNWRYGWPTDRRLRLNGATSLDVRLEADKRSVTLARGEAWFDVAHDAARPFSVTAGNSSTRVLGTAFDVDMARGEVKLAVYRGQVRFGPSAAGGPGATVIVPAGWRSRFRGNAAGAPTRFDSSQQDWRDGWLDTDAMRLDDVVEALNRGGGPLVLPPPAQAGRHPACGAVQARQFTRAARGDRQRLWLRRAPRRRQHCGWCRRRHASQ